MQDIEDEEEFDIASDPKDPRFVLRIRGEAVHAMQDFHGRLKTCEHMLTDLATVQGAISSHTGAPRDKTNIYKVFAEKAYKRPFEFISLPLGTIDDAASAGRKQLRHFNI